MKKANFYQPSEISYQAIILIFILYYVQGSSQSNSVLKLNDSDDELHKGEDLGDQIRAIVDHFKQPDPIGLPGAPIPDPMAIPDIKYSKSLTTFCLKNPMIYGLSKFKIEHLQSNLADMQVEIVLRYQKVELLGNYTLQYLLSRSSQGSANVTLMDVYFDGMATLVIARDGHLEADEINMDILVQKIIVDFKNLGFLGSIFQGMINTLGTYIFDNIKPYILEEVNTNIRGDINKMMKQLKKTFPNSIPPLDLAIAEGRKYVRENGFDPYKLEDYKYSSGLLEVDVNEIWFTGLASFYRIGNITVLLNNNTVQINSQISTQQLEGKCKWKVSLGQFISKYGHSSFTVDYIQIDTKLNQTLDVRNKPKLEDINLKLGNLQLRMDGTGTLDYGMELLANILPNVLRYQIIDAVEGVLKQRIQKELDLIDVEKYMEENIQNIDNMMAPNRTSNPFESTDNPFNLDQLYDEITQ